jgi:hypothetical protein
LTVLYAEWAWYRRLMETPVVKFFARRRTAMAMDEPEFLERAA